DLARGAEALPLADIDHEDAPRIGTGIGEFDRVLGGGVVPGSAVLVGGEPGIGKSTLLLQVANSLASPSIANRKSKIENLKVLYVTSEESARQTKLRAARLGVSSPNLLVLAETNVERIVNQIHKVNPAVVIIDSIQMIYKPDVPAAPGSVTQLRDCCMELVYLAKLTGIAVIFVGHVTKAGTLAGPKIIEHIVDTVVYFEGDRFHAHRIVRCQKNRFGSTHEVGLFEMTGEGFRDVVDPGNLFVEQYGTGGQGGAQGGGQPSGSVITAAMQGSRVLLVEVQALTASSVIGAAKRKVSGVSADRVGMIIAVLEKRAEMRLAADDVFVNVAGGVKVQEPAIDLAVALAIASAHLNRPMAPGTFAVGELGLGGEVRTVPQLETRLREASRLGLGHAIVPHMGPHIPKLGGMALHEVRRLQQAMADL
ncbi:MAG: DNA repair protein RadA, partial [Tepidisphaeraceae bacterium]